MAELDEKLNSSRMSKGSRKKKVPPLMARPLRGGGGKGQAIKEKRTFFETFFFILLPFKNKNYLFQTTYRNMDIIITLKFVSKYFHLVVTIFFKK